MNWWARRRLFWQLRVVRLEPGDVLTVSLKDDPGQEGVERIRKSLTLAFGDGVPVVVAVAGAEIGVIRTGDREAS